MISKASLRKNPFLGMFFKANDSVAFGPKTAPRHFDELMQSTLKVPLERLSISQSELVGLFCAFNSNGCVMPSFAEDGEVAVVKKAGLNVALINDHYALGNNILCNDKAALVNPAVLRADLKKISDALGVETSYHESLSRIQTVGAINAVTNRGLFSYNDVPDIELKKLKRVFGVGGGSGTVNMGVPFVGIGIVANSKGALVGEQTSGFETQRIYESLFG